MPLVTDSACLAASFDGSQVAVVRVSASATGQSVEADARERRKERRREDEGLENPDADDGAADYRRPIVAGFMNWLAPSVRAGVLSLAPPAAAALALVLYFNWRARLKRRIVRDAKRDQELATAA